MEIYLYQCSDSSALMSHSSESDTSCRNEWESSLRCACHRDTLESKLFEIQKKIVEVSGDDSCAGGRKEQVEVAKVTEVADK